MPATQAKRLIAVSTSLAEDKLLFHHMEAREELGRLFEYRVNLLSKDEQIGFDDILGQKMTVSLDLPDGEKRYFNGFVSQFTYTGRYRAYATYRAVLRPWLWFLTRTADCRIFQNKTVPDIIKEIFRDHPSADFDEPLSGQYRTWEYCVQYRETDFNFISRLMEQEGMYYYFKHEKDKHTLVLADSIGAHSRIPGYERVAYYPPTENVVREEDHIFDWYLSREVQPGTYVLDDFDFKRPKAELKVQRANPRSHAASEYEVFDYPGEYVTSAEGDGYVKARLEELQARWERVRGEGNARGLSVGGLFELTNYPRNDQNHREYLIVSAVHKLRSDAYETGVSMPSEPTYTCEFEAMGSKQPYRTPRTTVKPIVQGPQTAIVRGPAGAEIHTDEYGRVKVQFHWDRYGKNDENSSCWIRVSHAWAGQNWGMVAIPRMGQEVIVDFLEGDPDQPIITGRVYNADQMPPYGLPANATQTGILSRSSKGGSAANCNELRFEDKMGAEQVYLHAEKNQDIGVENDETHWVGHDRTKTIDHDETVLVKHDRIERVDNDESISIGHDRQMAIGRDKKEAVARNKSIQVDGGHSEKVSGSMTITVGTALTENVFANYAETVGGAMEITVGAAMAITVGGALAETVGAARVDTVGGSSTELVGGNKTMTVGKTLSETVKGEKALKVIKNSKEEVTEKKEVTIGKEYILKAKKIQMVAEDEINLKTGDAELVMKKNGDILIKGGKINVNGSGDVILKGSKIKGN